MCHAARRVNGRSRHYLMDLGDDDPAIARAEDVRSGGPIA
jgi:hypothetical protein